VSGRAGEPGAIVLSAETLGWLVRAAEAADRRAAAMGQTESGLQAVADRARAAEMRRDALWARLKDAERKESYYGELARKDADFSGTRDSYRRLRAEAQRLFDSAQASYDSALGGYLMLAHERERAPRPATPAPAPPRATGLRWGTFSPWSAATSFPAGAWFRAAPFVSGS
jgi:hypothetical protein